MDEPAFFRLGLGQPDDFGPLCNWTHMEQNNSGAILMEFKYNYTETCLNIADLYAEDMESHQGWAAPNGTCSWFNDGCDNEWRAVRPDAYDAAANYSVVTVIPTVIMPRLSEDLAVDEISLQAFEGEDCQDVSEDRPYRQWSSCDFADFSRDCSEIPFGVASIRIGYADSSDGCAVAAEESAGSRSLAVSLLGVFAVVATIGIMVQGA